MPQKQEEHEWAALALGCPEPLLSLSGVSPRRGFLSFVAFIHKGACSILPRQLALRARSQSWSASHRAVKAGHAGLRGRAEQLCQPRSSPQAGNRADRGTTVNLLFSPRVRVVKGLDGGGGLVGSLRIFLVAYHCPRGLPFPSLLIHFTSANPEAQGYPWLSLPRVLPGKTACPGTARPYQGAPEP